MKRHQTPLGMPKLYIGIKVEKEGKVLSERKEIGHSWTRNAWNAFTASMLGMAGGGSSHAFLGPGMMNAREVGSCYIFNGTDYTFQYSRANSFTFYNNGPYNSNAGNHNFGILIGANVNGYGFCANSVDLYNKIPHGTSAGQMSHQAQAAPVASYDTETRKWKNTITRIFNNNSGDAITVREIGLVFFSGTFYPTNSCLFAHDILDTPEIVPNAAQLTVVYEIESQEFTIDSDAILMGAAGSGGYVCGYKIPSNYPYCDEGFLLIMAPKATGEHSSKKYRDPGSSSGVPISYVDGQGNTNTLISLGANSEIGQFCSDARNAEIGGYNDWFIPAHEQIRMMFNFNLTLPSEERLTESVYYWTSTAIGTNAFRMRSTDSSPSYVNQSNSYYVRLIRMIHTSEFVPAE